jgi:hypothetical protein
VLCDGLPISLTTLRFREGQPSRPSPAAFRSRRSAFEALGNRVFEASSDRERDAMKSKYSCRQTERSLHQRTNLVPLIRKNTRKRRALHVSDNRPQISRNESFMKGYWPPTAHLFREGVPWIRCIWRSRTTMGTLRRSNRFSFAYPLLFSRSPLRNPPCRGHCRR